MYSICYNIASVVFYAFRFLASRQLEGEVLTTRLPGKSLGNIFPNVLEEHHSKGSKPQQFRHPVLEGNQNAAEGSPSSYHLSIYGE